jgi:hypothetical protein
MRRILQETLVTSLRVVVRQKLAECVFHLPLIEEDQSGQKAQLINLTHTGATWFSVLNFRINP